jgi:uncharacterized protein (TIGR00299 family) protein
MKTLYLKCKMGCAGDMLMGALSELVDQNAFVETMNHIGLENIEYQVQSSVKCGICGTHMKITAYGLEEKPDHHHDATFYFQIENTDDHKIHHILDHIEEIEGIHDVSYENGTLSYSFDHDHGDVAENKVREIFMDHIPEAVIHSHGHAHHEHESHHGHHGLHVKDVNKVIDDLHVSDKVKTDAKAVYKIIAEAESKAHGTDIEDIHFHEVGTLDAIADVVGNCVLFEMIGAERIYATPVVLGNGMVKCAHGILPVPAPATAYILQSIPTYAGNMEGELCTPTGAALLKHFVHSFEVMPTTTTQKIGYGMGCKDFPAANCVRAFLGKMQDDGEVAELTCNLDDITPENIGYAYDVLFREGALDVYVIPVHMKKNRPGYVFTCMCRMNDKDKMLKLMFQHLPTLGIRETACRRHALDRKIEKIQTSFGEVCVKISEGCHVKREKIEFEDLARIANEKHLSIEEIRKAILSERNN